MTGYSVGAGPIFLDQLNCLSSEESLLDCPLGRPVGLHRCNHSMDVGLRCQGMFTHKIIVFTYLLKHFS